MGEIAVVYIATPAWAVRTAGWIINGCNQPVALLASMSFARDHTTVSGHKKRHACMPRCMTKGKQVARLPHLQ